ncbi:type VI secretion system Vgr family protein [Celerinatantimonas diazotrophica]|uniref:Type VI secretion system secreted protein VgrG n=1 Tax=Celerinatantimonas diazotrophica TaxID=412034 RepID=A0A4R1K2B8_9GAMM|nr:type VI secretion system tip protein VgrG [Celerinatantimonas diazotrophica]TCK58155.1 type VI secretion system secreted protein VgrG [Celerinatantimonas diazotrophica]CAG9297773.1 Actin cross-linking toxin VgrG1 [Celerinatantimonas diazotrophica]
MAAAGRINFSIQVAGLSDDTFQVIEFHGHEALSMIYRYQIELASRFDNIEPENIVDQSVCLTLVRDGRVVRYVHGIVQSFHKADTGFHHTRYTLALVPSFARCQLRQNSRIFQTKTAVEIITTLLAEMGIMDYAFALKRTPAVREYCVQYRETDLAFIERLAGEEGIFYYFEHAQGQHTLCFCDQSNQTSQQDDAITYNATAGGMATQPYISSFIRKKKIAPATVFLKDYSFKNPAYSFLNVQQANDAEYQAKYYEHYDYPGRYKDDVSGLAFTKIRLEYLRRDAEQASIHSDAMQLTVGYRFKLTDHFEPSNNRTWLVTALSSQGTQPQALEEAGGTGATTFSNEAVLLPDTRPWRPQPNPKPRVDGPQMATVVGPAEEEIYCDEYGRVKIQFPWDREGEHDEQASCWVRVAQAWAGAQYGFVAIPRIGHEVIVSFLEGDPDQPIITGRTYHVSNQTPYPLPASKTVTTLKTQTHKGEGSNELRFEDEKDQEEVYLHAQKNMAIQVENSKNERVEYDRSVSIGHDEALDVANDRKVTVTGNQDHHTTGNFRRSTEGDFSNTVTGDLAQKIAGAFGISADGALTIKSGSKITLQVGGSFVVIHSGGVDINGSAINLNSGGSPGALPLPDSVQVLKTAAAEGSAFVANCPAV